MSVLGRRNREQWDTVDEDEEQRPRNRRRLDDDDGDDEPSSSSSESEEEEEGEEAGSEQEEEEAEESDEEDSDDEPEEDEDEEQNPADPYDSGIEDNVEGEDIKWTTLRQNVTTAKGEIRRWQQEIKTAQEQWETRFAEVKAQYDATPEELLQYFASLSTASKRHWHAACDELELAPEVRAAISERMDAYNRLHTTMCQLCRARTQLADARKKRDAALGL